MAKLDRSRIPSAANSGDPAPGARPVLPPRPLSNPPLPDTQHLELQQLEMLKGLRPANANGSQQPCWLDMYHPDHLEIQVLNTGVTIPLEEQKRVFEKFYRVPSADPWRQGGTGLGLALVQQRVSLLQGSIHLNSEANRTCFTLRLPRVLPVFGQGKPAQPRV